MLRVRCGWCGREFDAQRSTARYCSQRCRNAHKYAYRHGLREGVWAPPPPPAPAPTGRGDLCRLVATLRGCAAELDGMGATGPTETRELCRRLARKVVEALGEVGL